MAAAGRLPWAILVAAVALVVRLPLMFDPAPVIFPDSEEYLQIGDSVLHGHGFGALGLVRPPAYPLFVAAVQLLPGDTADAIVVVQHLIGVGLAVGVLLVTWQFFGKPAAIVAAALAAISPQLIAVEHDVLSDYLLTVFVFAGAALLARAAATRPTSLVAFGLAGVLFGVATLTKPVAQALVVVAPIVLALSVRQWRPVLRGSLAVVAGMALVVVPWVVRNDVQYGRPAVSTAGDLALFWRVFDSPKPLPFVGDDDATRLARDLYAGKWSGRLGVFTRSPRVDRALISVGYTRERAASIERTVQVVPPAVSTVYLALIARGRRPEQAEHIQRRMALRAIRAAPRAYLTSSASNARTIVAAAGPTPATQSEVVLAPSLQRARAAGPAPVRGPLGTSTARVLHHAFQVVQVWWMLSFFGLAGLVLLVAGSRRERDAILVFATALVALTAATALTAIPEPRYSAPILPLLFVIGSAGLVFVLAAVLARIREQRAA